MKAPLIATVLLVTAFGVAVVPPPASAYGAWCARLVDDEYPDHLVTVLNVAEIFTNNGQDTSGVIQTEDGFVLVPNSSPRQIVYYDYMGPTGDGSHHYIVTGWEGDCDAIAMSLCLLGELLQLLPNPLACLEPPSNGGRPENAQVNMVWDNLVAD